MSSFHTSHKQKDHGVSIWRNGFFVLSVIVAISFVVRLAALIFWGTGAIETEGAEYARIAENLRNGVGYVGIATPGPELMFPPLFPMLIAAASLLTNDYEWAGRIVSFVLGAILPIPVFGVASRLFGRKTAVVAALIAAFYPLFINLSIVVYSEGAYATILLSGVYLVLRALDRPSIAAWCLVGAAFGLAYLVRQEALAPLLIAIVFGFVATNGPLITRCKGAAAAIAVFAVLASLQIILIYRATGKLRLEGKSAINFALGSGVLEGQDSNESYAINDKLEPVGVWMRPNVDVLDETHIALKRTPYFVAAALRRNIPTLLEYLSARWFGSPFLLALALLGLLRRPWRRPLASRHLYVLLVPVIAVAAALCVLHTNSPRYYFVLLPFLVIWAANGLVEVNRWTKTTVAASGFRWVNPALSGGIVSGLVALAVVITPIAAVRNLHHFKSGSSEGRVTKDVGLWIREHNNLLSGSSIRIMDLSTPLAFHAGAQYVHFPYTNAQNAIRFLDAAKVDYVVLRRGAKFADYYEDWLARGIPDARAERVYVSSEANPGAFLVYAWHRNEKDIQASHSPQTAGHEGR